MEHKIRGKIRRVANGGIYPESSLKRYLIAEFLSKRDKQHDGACKQGSMKKPQPVTSCPEHTGEHQKVEIHVPDHHESLHALIIRKECPQHVRSKQVSGKHDAHKDRYDF